MKQYNYDVLVNTGKDVQQVTFLCNEEVMHDYDTKFVRFNLLTGEHVMMNVDNIIQITEKEIE